MRAKSHLFILLLFMLSELESQGSQFEGVGTLFTLNKIPLKSSITSIYSEIERGVWEERLFDNDINQFSYGIYEGARYLYFQFETGVADGGIYSRIPIEKSVLGPDGYSRFFHNGREILYFHGAGYVFANNIPQSMFWANCVNITKGISLSPEAIRYFIFDDGIEDIVAWSTLCEPGLSGSVECYSVERMRYPYIRAAMGDMLWTPFNGASGAWAEGDPGSGIGGRIVVKFKKYTQSFCIVNGFVDFERPSLFKENNRLKRATIYDKAIGDVLATVRFRDQVEITKVALPRSVDSVIIEINEVYGGLKFDDTCISKIFVPQEAIRPKAELLKEIGLMLQRDGFSFE